MKKGFIATISFLLLIGVMMIVVIMFQQENVIEDHSKLQIIATLFPQYDFAKHIVGDKAEVKLLLNSGIETHHYEPTPKDMMAINRSDLFLFTGTQLEPWTKDLLDTKSTNCIAVDISQNISFIKKETFEKKYMNSLTLTEKNQESKHTDEEIYDEHIWLNPNNAIKMIDNIVDSLCMIDLENANTYQQNAESYKEEIRKLDAEIESITQNSSSKVLAFGGEFSYAYLIERYGLKFVSVYTNCGEEEDPSITKVKSVIDFINENQIPTVFYEELTEGTVAKMIAEETEAEPCVLYSVHNANIQTDTYVSLMRKNVEMLKKALK